MHNVILKDMVFLAIDKKERECVLLGALLTGWLRDEVLSVQALHDGLSILVEVLEDFIVDAPKTLTFVGIILAPLVHLRVLTIATLCGPITDLLKGNGNAGKLLACVCTTLAETHGPAVVAPLLLDGAAANTAAMVALWSPLLAPRARDNVPQFLQDKKLEFLLS